MKEKPIWKKNLFVLSIAVFIAGIAFSEIMPFLSLYINTLGNFSHQQLNFWSGDRLFWYVHRFSGCFSLVGQIS